MVSIVKENRNGKTHYRIQFYNRDRQRRSIRLGRDGKTAETVRAHVEELINASIGNRPPRNATEQRLC